MKNNLEILLDTNPNGGCGCNCGCAGSSVVNDVNELVEKLGEYEFKSDISINVQPISELESEILIEKVNVLLSNTNANFRVDKDNLEETLSNMLPLIVLDDTILTAYGVPTFNDVVYEVEKSL